MVTVGDQHRPGAPSVGGIDEDATLLCLLNDPLDGGGFRADDRHQTVGRNHVAKADIDQFHIQILPFLRGAFLRLNPRCVP